MFKEAIQQRMHSRHWYSKVVFCQTQIPTSKESTCVHCVSDQKAFCSVFLKWEYSLNTVFLVRSVYFTSPLCVWYREKRFIKVLQLKQLVSTQVSCYCTMCVYMRCKMRKREMLLLHFFCSSTWGRVCLVTTRNFSKEWDSQNIFLWGGTYAPVRSLLQVP
jgi:hypothetical protein